MRKRYGPAPAIGQYIIAATIARERCTRTDVLKRPFDAAAIIARAQSLTVAGACPSAELVEPSAVTLLAAVLKTAATNLGFVPV